jgi:hypothetical protein
VVALQEFDFQTFDEATALVPRAHAAPENHGCLSQPQGVAASGQDTVKLRCHRHDIAAGHMVKMAGRHVAIAH